MLKRLCSLFGKNITAKQRERELHCPHCNGTDFYAGPQGGAGRNILCATCHHEYVVIEGLGIIAQELGVATSERLKWPYGIGVESNA